MESKTDCFLFLGNWKHCGIHFKAFSSHVFAEIGFSHLFLNFFHFPSHCWWQWDGNSSICGHFTHSPRKSRFKDETQLKLGVGRDSIVKRSQSLVYDFLWPIANQTTQRMCERFDLHFFLCFVSFLHHPHVFRFISIFIAAECDIIQHETKKYHLPSFPTHISFFGYSFRISINIKRSDVDDDVENGPTLS